MTINLTSEQGKVVIEAINSGLASSPQDALNQVLQALRGRLPRERQVDESVAAAARRLGTFGKRHGFALDGMTVKELLRESRPSPALFWTPRQS